jgi:hypothetical protein
MDQQLKKAQKQLNELKEQTSEWNQERYKKEINENDKGK